MIIDVFYRDGIVWRLDDKMPYDVETKGPWPGIDGVRSEAGTTKIGTPVISLHPISFNLFEELIRWNNHQPTRALNLVN